MTDQPSNEAAAKSLVSLKDFIETNQKTMAVTGVFVALALFWKTIQHEDSTPYVSYLCLLITVPLLIEILREYDYAKASWNLFVFMQIFYGVVGFTLYYLVTAYPSHLEKIINAVIYLVIYLPLLALGNKIISKFRQRDYEARVAYIKSIEDSVSIELRNDIVTSGNSRSARFFTYLDILTFLLVVVLSFFIWAPANSYVHATFDAILERSPNIEPPNTKLELPTPPSK